MGARGSLDVISLSDSSQRTLHRTSGDPMAAVNAQKQPIMPIHSCIFTNIALNQLPCTDSKTATCQRSKYCPPLALICPWVIYCDFWGEFFGS